MTAGIDAPLRFVAGNVSLEGHLHAPAAPVGAAVVCHPHPQYGGTMDNNVVVAVADALVHAGVATLRFNFRGVGGSDGSHGGGRDEVQDVLGAVDCLATHVPGAPLSLVGYSFGAVVVLQAGCDGLPGVRAMVGIAPPVPLVDLSFLARCALPVCLVAGDRDGFCERGPLEHAVAGSPRASIVWITGADHFLLGDEGRVAEAVVRFVRAPAGGAGTGDGRV